MENNEREKNNLNHLGEYFSLYRDLVKFGFEEKSKSIKDWSTLDISGHRQVEFEILEEFYGLMSILVEESGQQNHLRLLNFNENEFVKEHAELIEEIANSTIKKLEKNPEKTVFVDGEGKHRTRERLNTFNFLLSYEQHGIQENFFNQIYEELNSIKVINKESFDNIFNRFVVFSNEVQNIKTENINNSKAVKSHVTKVVNKFKKEISAELDKIYSEVSSNGKKLDSLHDEVSGLSAKVDNLGNIITNTGARTQAKKAKPFAKWIVAGLVGAAVLVAGMGIGHHAMPKVVENTKTETQIVEVIDETTINGLYEKYFPNGDAESYNDKVQALRNLDLESHSEEDVSKIAAYEAIATKIINTYESEFGKDSSAGKTMDEMIEAIAEDPEVKTYVDEINNLYTAQFPEGEATTIEEKLLELEGITQESHSEEDVEKIAAYEAIATKIINTYESEFGKDSSAGKTMDEMIEAIAEDPEVKTYVDEINNLYTAQFPEGEATTIEAKLLELEGITQESHSEEDVEKIAKYDAIHSALVEEYSKINKSAEGKSDSEILADLLDYYLSSLDENSRKAEIVKIVEALNINLPTNYQNLSEEDLLNYLFSAIGYGDVDLIDNSQPSINDNEL